MDDLLLPVGFKAPLIATFHSTCVRVLRQHGRHIGLPPHFVIYDEDDRGALVRGILRDQELSDRTFTPSAVAQRISWLKNRMRDPVDAEREARGPWEEKVAGVFKRYEERLKTTGGVDFDDLLLKTVQL